MTCSDGGCPRWLLCPVSRARSAPRHNPTHSKFYLAHLFALAPHAPPIRQTPSTNKPPFAFRRAVPEGVSVSANGLAVSRMGTAGWANGASLVEPAFSSAERHYAEWVIEEADFHCSILIGVTDLDAAPPAGQRMHDMPGSRMYSCYDSKAFPGHRNWGAAGRRARGDRVGLLVERGGVWVYVNGARLGPGPMATDLPKRVRTARIGMPTAPKI